MRRPAAAAHGIAAAPAIRGRGQAPGGMRRPARAGIEPAHPAQLGAGDWILANEAHYYGQHGTVGGEVLEEKTEEGRRMVSVKLSGTTMDTLLQWAGQAEAPSRWHLCPTGCLRELEGDGLVHVTQSQKVSIKELEGVGWATNLRAVIPPEDPVDENAALRERIRRLEQDAQAGDRALRDRSRGRKDRKKEKERSRNRSEERRREKKRRKKRSRSSSRRGDKKGSVDRKEARASPDGHRGGGGRSKARGSMKRSSSSSRGTGVGQVSQRKMFRGTALDLSQRTRKRVHKKAQRFLKKKRSSSSDSESTGDSQEVPWKNDQTPLFGDELKIRGVAERFPGLLAGEALKGIARMVASDMGDGPSSSGRQWPPQLVRYYRQVLSRRISGAMARELLNRLAPGGQGAPSAGHLFTAHQRAGTSGWWNQFPNQPAFGGVAQRSGYPPQSPGVGHHPEGAQPGSQGLWWGPIPAAPDWEGQVWPPGRPTHLQREGSEGKGQEQVRREEKRGEQERWIRPSSVALGDAGGGSPESREQRSVTMCEFFPNYHGPLSHKNVLFLRAEPLETSKETAVATSAGPAPRGDFSNREATSASSKKVPPLGLRLGLMGGLLKDRFLEVLLHSQPSGKGNQLPFSPYPLLGTASFLSFVVRVRRKLIGLWLFVWLLIPIGVAHFIMKVWSPSVTKEFWKVFLHDIRRLSEITDTVDEFDWAEFFRCRTIDYRGEEVKTARSFSWANIGPTLPKEIGIVQLRDVCEQGCQYYVDHFPEFLKPVQDWPHVKNSRVMVRDGDWPEVAASLVKAGVCQVIPESEVFKVRGKPLLNGSSGSRRVRTARVSPFIA